MDSLLPPDPSSLPQPLLTTTPERTREIETFRDAFLQHPKSAHYLHKQSGLGKDIPWVMVSCDCAEGTVDGIVVGGDWENVGLEWDFDGHFTVFTNDGFLGVNGWMFGRNGIEVQGRLPGTGA